MPFEINKTYGQKREDRGSELEGKRRCSSLESKPWKPPQQVLLGRYLVLEGAKFWVPSYSRRELDPRLLSFADAAHGHGC